MSSINRALTRGAPAVPLILRVVIGSIMALHGWQKLTQMGPANFGNNMLAGLGIPAPVLFGNVVTYIELIGGLMLIIGLGTRIVSILLTVILAVATVLVKTDLGIIAPMGSPLPGAELDLALIVGLISLVILGPGRLSADNALGIDEQTVIADPVPSSV